MTCLLSDRVLDRSCLDKMRYLAIAVVALLLEAAAVPQADEFRKNLKGRTDAKEATKASMNKAPKLSSCASRSM